MFGWSKFCVEFGGSDKFYFTYDGIFIEKHVMTPLEIQHMSIGQYPCQV